jgi:hypothetical protein
VTAWGRRGDDPASALADILDALDNNLRLTKATAKRSEKNRLRMLYVHGAAAVIIAPLFLAYSSATGLTSASWNLLRSLPGAPTSVAAWLFVGGIVAMLGTAARHTGVACVGLALLACWYLSFAATFTYAAWEWWRAGANESTMPALYAGPVYSHFAAIMLVHLVTALRMRGRREP